MNEDRKFAIEDARTHLAAQFDLIKFHDQKAMALLSLYVTLGIATVGLALTAFGKDSLIGPTAAVGLAGASAALFVGALYCFRTIEGSSIWLPGRGFEFWSAFITPIDDKMEGATRSYLVDGIKQTNDMRDLNVLLAGRLSVAKGAGVAAPFVAAIFGGLAEAYTRFI